MAFAASELILSPEGRVYHLDLSPGDISHKVILVGDQDRVALVSRFFDQIELKRQKREFVCHTGFYKGKRLSVISTGIGTDNIDIVLNELDILANYDLKNRCLNERLNSLEIIRIGTCGALQANIKVGSYILSKGAIGLDSLAHYYEFQPNISEFEILDTLKSTVTFPPNITPYYTEASAEIIKRFERNTNTTTGITLTACGFYGPQGRALRIPLIEPGFIHQLAQVALHRQVVVNLEMETSAILALSKMMGHKASTICLALANRANGEFLNNYSNEMDALIEYVLEQF